MASQITGGAEVAIHTYQALYGKAPSYALLQSYTAQAAVDSRGWANQLATGFSSMSDADFTTLVLTNLGVTATSIGADAYAALAPAVAGYFTSVGVANRGVVVVQVGELLSNLEGDATYGAAALAFNNQSLADFNYGSNSANTNPAVVAPVDSNAGQTYTLTTSIDAGAAFKGLGGNDTYNALVAAAGSTLTALDNLDGGAGNNVLNINQTGGVLATALTGVTIANIQTINVNSSIAIALDLTTPAGVSGVTLVNASGLAGGDDITVGSGTAVVATDGAGAVSVHGTDSAVTVTAGGAVVVDTGASTETVSAAGGVTLSGATGAVVATDSAQGVANSTIDDGTSVSLTTAYTAGGAGVDMITIGGTTKPTGAVSVMATVAGTKAADNAAGAIAVNGGTTVAVTEVATQKVNAAPAAGATNVNHTVTQSAVTVNGSTATTSVVINQSAAVAVTNTTTAQAGATEVDAEAFVALTPGQTLIVGGLTFTAGAAGTTAAQTAAAFANLSVGSTHGASTLGAYSGVLAGWSTGAVSGAAANVVGFTWGTANAVHAAPLFAGTGTAPTATNTTTGAVATAAVAGVGGVSNGVDTVLDASYAGATANTITSVTLNGYATGSAVSSSALTSLSLANGAGTVTVNNKAAATLGLTVNGLAAASVLNIDGGTAATYKALNITTATADSALDVVATGVTALTVTGTNAVDLTGGAGDVGNASAALKTVTVSGAAGVTGVFTGAAVTDFNAAATSGAITATIDATKATYEGGSGADKVTLSAVAPTKAISLGAGNDTLILAAGTTSVTGAIDGGTGSDTLTMNTADAVTASTSGLFASKVGGFEVLSLNTAGAGAQAIDVAQLGNYANVTTLGSAGVLTLNNFVSGGTLTETAAAAGSVVLANTAFTAGTADSINLVISKAGSVNIGTVTADKVESFSIAAGDTTAHAVAGASVDTVTLGADSTLATISVTGNATLALTSANTTVTLVDASGATGGLTYTTAGTTAETVKGGAAANTLTAHTGTTADVLIGGAGNDVITSNAGLDTLTGHGGNDAFVINAAANVNSYATITDANAGDRIVFASNFGTGVETFVAAKISLAATAVFQDYANAAVNAGAAAGANGYIAWFQYSGDTYVVEATASHAVTHDFQNGADLIVKLTGLVDLSTATLNTGDGTYAGATIQLH